MNKFLALIALTSLLACGYSLSNYKSQAENVEAARVAAIIDSPAQCPTVAQLNATDWQQCGTDQECADVYYSNFGIDAEHCEYED